MAGIPKTPRSGGPKTTAGKVATSRNAIKTGVYSAMVVIPGESEEDFRALHEEFLASFKPHDVAESAIIHDLTVLTWKKLRLERLEKANFVRALEKPIKAYEISNQAPINEVHEWLLLRLDNLTPEYLKQNKLQRTYMATLNKAGVTVEEFCEMPKLCPGLYLDFVTFSKDYYVINSAMPAPESFITLEHTSTPHGKELFIRYALREIKTRLDQTQYVGGCLVEIQAAVTNVKEKRLLDLIQVQGVMRAHDDLSRAFYRTLSELRRQQSWRQKISAIDVTPEQINE